MDKTPLIKPLTGYYLSDNANVLAPPYDVLSGDEVRHYSEQDSLNLAHITRAETCLGKSELDDDALAYAQHKLNDLKEAPFVKAFSEPSIALYQIKKGDHSQTGFISLTHVNKIKKHEHTRQKKIAEQKLLTGHLKSQISPILVCYQDHDELTTLLDELCCTLSPVITTHDQQGYEHALFIPFDKETQERLLTLAQQLPHLYIADGHHRHQTLEELSQTAPDDFVPYVLSVAFCEKQLNILGYHRLFKAKNSQECEAIIHALKHDFSLQKQNAPISPTRLNQVGVCHKGDWYLLTIKNPKLTEDSTGAGLLQAHIFEPLLNVTDLRADPRLSFIGGETALLELEKQSLEETVLGFSVCPVSAKTLISIADNMLVMPPKSTWFEPKLLDGFILE